MSIRLSDGRDLTPDLSHVTLRAYRKLFAEGHAQAEEDAVIAGAYGLTVDEFLEVNIFDYQALVKGFFEAARNPAGASPS